MRQIKSKSFRQSSHSELLRETSDHFAEEDLSKEESLYRSLLDSSHDVIYRFNLQTGKYEYISPSIKKVTGYSIAEIKKLGTGALFAATDADDHPAIRSALSRLNVSGREELEGRVLVNGEYRWLSDSMFLIRDKSGRPLYRDGFVRDITDRKRAQEALRVSEERYRNIVQDLTELVCRFLPDGSLTFVNPAFCKMAEMSESELLGKSFFRFLADKDISRVSAFMHDVLPANPDSSINLNVYVNDKVYWMHWNGRALFDPEGNVIEYQAAGRDMTAQKKAEEAVRASMKKTETVLASVTDMYVSYDNEWRFVDLNPLAEKLMGKNRQELIGKVLWKIFPQLKGTVIHKKYMRASRDRVNERFESFSPVTRCWHEFYLYPTDEGLSVYMRNITDRKLAEEALREREAKLQSILNAAPVGIGVTMNRNFTEVNRAFCEMIGYPADEVLGRNARMIYPSDEAYENLGRVKYEMMREKGVGTVETKLQHKSGRIMDIIMSSTPIDPSHIEKGVTFTVLDITHRKRMEEILKRSNFELEERDVARTAELLEMNKSLQEEIEERKSIEQKLLAAQKKLRAMASEIILSEEQSRQRFATDLHDTVVQTLGAAKMRSQFIEKDIQKKVRPIFAEIQSLLSDSIVQARSIMTEMSPPVLNELGIVSALEWLTEQFGNRYGIPMKFHSKDKKKALSLSRDIEVLLFQATRETLMNIVKHSNARSASVRFSNHDRHVKLEVTDNGIGFDIKKSFQPDLKGGFGLYSIRERLRHFGGVLAIKTRSGQGTTVLISAPQKT